MAGPDPDGWCILRTAGRHTIRLAESLKAAGIEAWTPIETRTVTIPRANLKRSVTTPIMPSYVFAKWGNEARLGELFDLARADVKAHPAFRVMVRYGDGVPIITNRDLRALRREEAARNPKKAAAAAKEKAERPFAIGEEVRLGAGHANGSLAGMAARVERSDCANTLVLIGDKLKVTISTSILRRDDIGGDSSLLGMAAE